MLELSEVVGVAVYGRITEYKSIRVQGQDLILIWDGVRTLAST
jgi:hypothetical protein